MPSPFHRSSARLRVVSKHPADEPRPPRSRRPHRNETVAKVRRLIETTPLTYGEIAARTGVGRASICRWTRDGGWRRHLFAPRATDTVPRERAGARLKLRTLAARIAALAERYVRELEETPGVELAKLGEALALYQMAKLASLPRHRPRKRRRVPAKEMARPLGPHAPPALRMLTEMQAAGVNLDRAPEAAVKDYIVSRLYEDPKLRPRNRTRRQRYEDWLREKEWKR